MDVLAQARLAEHLGGMFVQLAPNEHAYGLEPDHHVLRSVSRWCDLAVVN